MDAAQQLADHVRYRIGSKSLHLGAGRCDELTRLVVMHWPHRHLESAMADGLAPRKLDQAKALLRAAVREHWEARHGIGPAWAMLMAPAVAAIWHVLLDLWAADPTWAARLEEIGAALRRGARE